MRQVAILGSGFGLSGYLPALARLGLIIILPERSQARFFSNVELTPLAPQIRWLADEHAAIEAASCVVLALPPAQQATWLPICLAKKNLTHFLVEKPLAKSPHDALNLLTQLTTSNKKYCIGYLFRYTQWGKKLLAELKKQSACTQLSINWHFMAHHYQQSLATWKRDHSEGGSVLRFYGLDLLALLAELGYDHVVSSALQGPAQNEYDRWDACFSGRSLPLCHIHINTRAEEPLFQIKHLTETATLTQTTLSDPFALEPQYATEDRRVALIRELSTAFFTNSDDTMFDFYQPTLMLWQQTENQLMNEKTVYEEF